MTETEVKEKSPFYSSFSRWAYDVFLNFRGADTRAGFTTALNKALTDRGIRTFFDDDKLPRGQRISRSLVGAIEESRFAVVLFSPSYAASSYCLDELVRIMSCCKGKEGRLVLPVFYDVDPSQVRYQGGAYGEALERHLKRKSCDNGGRPCMMPLICQAGISNKGLSLNICLFGGSLERSLERSTEPSYKLVIT